MQQNLFYKSIRNVLCFGFFVFFLHINAQNDPAVFKQFVQDASELPIYKKKIRTQKITLYDHPKEGYQIAIKDGQFGFFNRDFDWAVPPQYDVAFPFHEGLGIVFLNEQPMYVDGKHQQPFKTDFAKDLSPFKNGKAYFKTHSGKMGMFNKKGELIIDTIYKRIYLFDDEISQYFIPKKMDNRLVTVVQGFNSRTEEVEQIQYGKKTKITEKVYECALIDSNGSVVIPFGTFKRIEHYLNGYATASTDVHTVLLNSEGKEVFRLSNDSIKLLKIETPITVKNGLIKVYFVRPQTFDADYGDPALMNFNKEIAFKDTNLRSMTDWDDRKALFLSREGTTVTYFDKNAIKPNLPALKSYLDLAKLNERGTIEVSTEKGKKEKWGIIDANFNWVLPPQYDRVHHQDNDVGQFYLLVDNLPQKGKDKDDLMHRDHRSGLADAQGKLVFPTKFMSIHPMNKTFQKFQFVSANGQIRGTMDRNEKILSEYPKPDTTRYKDYWRSKAINVHSKMDWQIWVDNLDCKGADERVKWGIRSACNTCKKMSDGENTTTKSVHIAFSEKDTILVKRNYSSEKIKAIQAKLINSTRDTVFFTTNSSNELSIILQAKDKQGVWQDISNTQKRKMGKYESEPKPIIVGLPPQYFWSIDLPTFEGAFKTHCRAIIKSGRAGEADVISEEWEAGINAAQFWKSAEHDPNRVFRIHGTLYENED